MLTSSQIRQQFIDFFVERHGHAFAPSSPVVPLDDPTLLFTNAGMNQFKDVFLGLGNRPYRRAVNTQKCIRAGGKHNDLEDVGKDTYHHTFFEMLGNWSFGDYFKAEAIRWAWELLTEVWGLDKSRLHATVFAGAADSGLERDDEAAEFWRTATDIDPANIHLGGMKDNFWEMGETGPCGPCSEVHYDRTPDKSGRALVNAGDARVIEIWNLVFIQFNRDASGRLTPLPARHVDTGMGFERLCAVLQGKSSNYDTDIFQPIFAAIAKVTGAAPYTGSLERPEDVAYRVLADHIRTLVFALSDGAVPSNEGRGYVLRRILRRASRYGRQSLGVHEPFFYRLVPTVVDCMGSAFPELRRAPVAIANLIREEEELFGKTLDRGIALFAEAAERGGAQISGRDAFELYATYGFPLDLTQLMARERGLTVDDAGFAAELERHREVSRAGGAAGDVRQALLEALANEALPATEFVGYTTFVTVAAPLQRLFRRRADGRFEPASSLHDGSYGAVVVQRTPFYAEGGGQVGDAGTIRTQRGDLFLVEETIKLGETWIHLGRVEAGKISLADHTGDLAVDASRRTRTMVHHTATHVMNWALRAVLGDHVQQKGSLVDEEKTRFDFSHNKPLTAEQISALERSVADVIGRDLPVYAHVAPQHEALKIHGLRAVFGEKYPPQVRVVSIGQPVTDLLADPTRKEWYDYSIEFCGGTHVERTGQIASFTIVSEEAVAKGVRRVTAVAGEVADRAAADGAALFQQVSQLRSRPRPELEKAIAAVVETVGAVTAPLAVKAQVRAALAELQQSLKEEQKQRARSSADEIVAAARRVAEENTGPIIVANVAEADNQGLRTAMDVIRQRRPEAAMLLGSAKEGKVSFVAAVPPALVARGLNAGEWVRTAASTAGGSGGGRPEMAQAGAKDPAQLPAALDAARQFAAKCVPGT